MVEVADDGIRTSHPLLREVTLATIPAAVRRELFRGELDDPMRAVLIFSRKLGEALVRGGQLNDAEGVLREALDVAGPSGKDRAAVLGALAHVAHDRDRRQEARDYLREALELASRSGAHELVTSLETLRRAIAV